MIPVTITLPDFVSGDTWQGMTIGPILFNGAQPSYALLSCRLHFRNYSGSLAFALSSSPQTGQGSIIISNAVTWSILIPAQVLSLVAGKYSWDFETVDSEGVIRTLYEGVQNVLRDYTHD